MRAAASRTGVLITALTPDAVVPAALNTPKGETSVLAPQPFTIKASGSFKSVVGFLENLPHGTVLVRVMLAQNSQCRVPV